MIELKVKHKIMGALYKISLIILNKLLNTYLSRDRLCFGISSEFPFSH